MSSEPPIVRFDSRRLFLFISHPLYCFSPSFTALLFIKYSLCLSLRQIKDVADESRADGRTDKVTAEAPIKETVWRLFPLSLHRKLIFPPPFLKTPHLRLRSHAETLWGKTNKLIRTLKYSKCKCPSEALLHCSAWINNLLECERPWMPPRRNVCALL